MQSLRYCEAGLQSRRFLVGGVVVRILGILGVGVGVRHLVIKGVESDSIPTDCATLM